MVAGAVLGTLAAVQVLTPTSVATIIELALLANVSAPVFFALVVAQLIGRSRLCMLCQGAFCGESKRGRVGTRQVQPLHTAIAGCRRSILHLCWPHPPVHAVRAQHSSVGGQRGSFRAPCSTGLLLQRGPGSCRPRRFVRGHMRMMQPEGSVPRVGARSEHCYQDSR
jgi:hypothetical protein